MTAAALKPRTQTQRRPVDADRRALYGKLQIARKALGLLDDGIWRDLLDGRYGKTSRTALTRAELVDLVEHFKAQGFKASKPKRAGKRPLARGEEARKIRALWLTLWNLGCVKEPSEEALASFTKRVTGGKDRGVDALQWLNSYQASKVIEALKAWAARPVGQGGGGVDWSGFETANGTVYYPRRRVIGAQLRILVALGELRSDWIGQAILPGQKEEELDPVIAGLGARIRAVRKAAPHGG